MTTEPIPEPRARRPFGVLVLIVVQVFRAAVLFVQVAGLYSGEFFGGRLAPAIQVPEPPPGTVAFWISRVLVVGLLAASLVIAVGLFRLRHWAWVGAIVLSGLSLAVAIGAWWAGDPRYSAMVINVVAVFYLNQRETRAAFDVPIGR